MKVRKQDANGDYTLGTGQDHYQDVPDAVRQAVLTRLRLWRDTWFLDNLSGVPWLGGVLGKTVKTGYDAVIRSAIAGTPGLKSIVDYSSTLNPDTRELTVSAKIDTVYGISSISTTQTL